MYVHHDDGFKLFASTRKNNTLLTAGQMSAVFAGKPVKIHGVEQGTPVAVYAGVITDFSGSPIGVLEIVMDRSEYVVALHKSMTFNSVTGVIFVVVGILLAIVLARAKRSRSCRPGKSGRRRA